jgi:hypothetical protein
MVMWPCALGQKNIMVMGTHGREALHFTIDRKQRKGIQEGARTRYSPQGHNQ